VLDSTTWLPQNAIAAMASERRPWLIPPALSPAGQPGDLGSDLLDQALRVAGDAHNLVAAGRAGNNREIAAGKVPASGEQL